MVTVHITPLKIKELCLFLIFDFSVLVLFHLLICFLFVHDGCIVTVLSFDKTPEWPIQHLPSLLPPSSFCFSYTFSIVLFSPQFSVGEVDNFWVSQITVWEKVEDEQRFLFTYMEHYWHITFVSDFEPWF